MTFIDDLLISSVLVCPPGVKQRAPGREASTPNAGAILDPSAIVPVPVYSSKFSSRGPSTAVIGLSDSEEDEAEHTKKKTEPEVLRIPVSSPPPPESPVQKQSRRVKQKISEIDRTLRAVTSLLSPDPHDRRTTRRSHLSAADDDVIIVTSNDDDVIAVTPDPGVQDSPYSSSVREIPLKVRLPDRRPQDSRCCRVRRHGQRRKNTKRAGSSGIVSVRLQSKDRDSSQEFTLHRDAPLGSIFSQYLSRMSSVAQRSVCFQFDGSKVSDSQTPAELDMEDGDIIEVWI
ncbi:NFATC2-interacting protein [Nibea albiflora]|uniref:NFATC2-interacting protein n=1 Tax=Nibea albiflora TaxID=240163 RepID=A0ACB7EXT3_NIBAL|nr:NFATC2-interacting protein [Nibea albiflora]